MVRTRRILLIGDRTITSEMESKNASFTAQGPSGQKVQLTMEMDGTYHVFVDGVIELSGTPRAAAPR